MLHWLNASLNRKIGSLFVVLFSFLFIVIIFSIYKLRLIDFEMKEVAEIDIPLNEVMVQAEMLQLKQHVFMEQFRRLGGDEMFTDPKVQFSERRQELVQLLNSATHVIRSNIERHRIRFELLEHKELLREIQAFHRISNAFENQLGTVLDLQNVSASEWQAVETLSVQLDKSMSSILHQIETLSLEAARYTEKHEREFMFINGLLGAGAFVIGLFLTVYIIQIIRFRILRIHSQVENIHQSLAEGGPIQVDLTSNSKTKPQDELDELEQDLQKMVSRLSDEMDGRIAVEKQLLTLATRDKLTGAYNRHKWDEQIKISLDLAQRGSEFSLIMMDIDHFKKVNDQYGHQVGDKVLQFFVTSLTCCLRKSDLLFRLGGEEFAVLLPQQSIQQAAEVGERIRQRIETADDANIPAFTVSLGISSYHEDDEESSILTRADKALYRSKLNGRNMLTLEIES
ncbi:GGDEF domain-containing protein [Marinomonas balearica]|uniref:diguanylate cyclase n=1 Tax=Marinomonas balearica TaxID=491947 RepID=A0A4R6MDE3_9GAMM|nr:GGDEF domain-containing protein [Marinomonas balearica]TDO99406.1 diguanylate cyclase (GGDEF)-like protein [Marinomonas balearica]